MKNFDTTAKNDLIQLTDTEIDLVSGAGFMDLPFASQVAWAWNKFTFFVAGSDAKFTATYERSATGVRG